MADTRTALATAAAWWYGDPSRDLAVVGITGTDGKTTTSFLAVAALEAAGIRTGMTGTAETRIGGVQARQRGPRHDPRGARAPARARGRWHVAGDAAAVIETTSHGLALDRVDAIAYDVAILTNLTHEHLELHGTWEAYRDAKLRLFEQLARPPEPVAKPLAWPATGIVNADDPSAGAFIGVAQEAGARVLTYGTDPAADVRATRVEEDQRRLRIAYDAPSGRGHRRPPAGRAASTSTTRSRSSPSARRSGSTRRRSATASPRVPVVPGRMERDRRSASRSGSSSTSPTARRRSRPSSTCSRRWRRRAAGD